MLMQILIVAKGITIRLHIHKFYISFASITHLFFEGLYL